MASAAEQMAANTSWSALGKATDLRNRILFTLALLCVYRLGTFLPVPGIDGAALREFMEQAGQGIGGMVSMFTGGALGRMGIFALGIMKTIGFVPAASLVFVATVLIMGYRNAWVWVPCAALFPLGLAFVFDRLLGVVLPGPSLTGLF